MKNLFFIFVCLVAFQANSQEGMQKSTNKTDTQQPDAAAAPLNNKVEIYSETCPIEGYKVSLSRDAGNGNGVSSKRYIGVEGIRKTFYATASQVSGMSGFTGLPTSYNNPIIFNGGGQDEYLKVELVNVDPEKTYCDQNGFRLPHGLGEIYKVHMGDNHQEWSGQVTIMDGTNLDSAHAAFLIKKYNLERGFTGNDKVPESCKSTCFDGDTGVPNEPWPTKPGTFTDAAGNTYDGIETEDDSKEPIKETKKKELKLKKI